MASGVLSEFNGLAGKIDRVGMCNSGAGCAAMSIRAAGGGALQHGSL